MLPGCALVGEPALRLDVSCYIVLRFKTCCIRSFACEQAGRHMH